MSKKRPRLWYAQSHLGMLYLWAWVFAYYSGQAIPEPQLSDIAKFPRFLFGL